MNSVTLMKIRAGFIDIHQDESPATLTVHIESPDAVGHSVRVQEPDGITWYGKVDADGVALLTRQDLLPT